ncbi:Chlorophyll(ide) b reductase NOL, chloroplastic [Morella rubra]|uniref:Chlorophyll(Ide) b reductase NOL, chloroplastic n=1 Tax=Morella rubra TaxID=262757 RepID=A0A6A1UP10_9ROSI|nr:Chlorophyll(ide) b reductase NOL, chloroplastic [Morella rubra]
MVRWYNRGCGHPRQGCRTHRWECGWSSGDKDEVRVPVEKGCKGWSRGRTPKLQEGSTDGSPGCTQPKDVKNRLMDSIPSLQSYPTLIVMQINNAGSNAYSYKPLSEASDEDLIDVVTTNTLGLMICCREAIKMMLNQRRGGHIFNIDGAGSDGRPTPRLLAQNKLSPLLQAKFFINVLAEPAEVVAEYLVPNIRSVAANGSMKPTYIRFLTGIKAYSQIFSVKN